MSGLHEALVSALNAHGEATLDNGARVRVLPEAILRDVLALHDSPVAASRERVAEVLRAELQRQGVDEFYDVPRLSGQLRDALLAAGVFRDEATVKAEALVEAARQIVVPGASSRAAEWLQAQAALIRDGGQS